MDTCYRRNWGLMLRSRVEYSVFEWSKTFSDQVKQGSLLHDFKNLLYYQVPKHQEFNYMCQFYKFNSPQNLFKGEHIKELGLSKVFFALR